MPLSEVAGNVGTVSPAQIVSEVPKLKAGVMFGFTVTVRVVPFAHWPTDGVNVYVAEVVLLMTEGLQLPAIPFVEVEGRKGTLSPGQMARDVPKQIPGLLLC